jgi:hypothetical protein
MNVDNAPAGTIWQTNYFALARINRVIAGTTLVVPTSILISN